jgi:Transposase and inactivated derivatives
MPQWRPFGPGEIAQLSATVSPTAGKRYGVQRVCAIFEQPRSSFYARQRSVTQATDQAAMIPRKRGPKVAVSDVELLELIRADLTASPFRGEGYRKVWARLRVQRQVRVSAKRVLRLMRENQLLSPWRGRQATGPKHERQIITDAPNQMWGTDGTKIFTVDDGWIWLFTAIEHWNAECVGWHVAKIGSRYAALEPISMAMNNIYGAVTAKVARGLALRMDHGTQYLSDHFLNQVRFWGIQPSFGFIQEPETNGVAERFNRTLKEQAIYGRVFRNIEEVRTAVAAFIHTYNEHWLIQKLGHRSPAQARRDLCMAKAA